MAVNNREVSKNENDGDKSQNRDVERNQSTTARRTARKLSQTRLPPESAPGHPPSPPGSGGLMARGESPLPAPLPRALSRWARRPGSPWEGSSPKAPPRTSPPPPREQHRSASSRRPALRARALPRRVGPRRGPRRIRRVPNRTPNLDPPESPARRQGNDAPRAYRMLSKSSSRFPTGSASGWRRARRLRKFSTRSDNSSLQSWGCSSTRERPATVRFP